MAVESTPGFLQNLTYSAEVTRRSINSPMLLRGSTVGSAVGGLVNPSDLQVTWASSGLTVSVSTGEAMVPGSSSTTQSAYYLRNAAPLTLSPAAANPSNPRIDLVAAEIADSTYTGATNTGSIAIITGTPTGGATLSNLNGSPSLPTSSLALAYVLIPAGATTINNTDILNVATIIRPANYPAPGTLLGSLTYGNALSNSHYTASTSGSLTAVDTTNLRLTVTAPASGRLLARWSAYCAQAGGDAGWGGILNGASVVAGPGVMIGAVGANVRATFEGLITGLTPGTSYALDVAAYTLSSGGDAFTINYGTTNGPITYVVLAA